ncbi:hypothetical protein KDL44_16095 [bacterium]|nr:hypothetical protein [bacterium]
MPTIEEVTYSPQEIHPGDLVLISYRIGSKTVHDGGTYTQVWFPPELRASAGEITPISPADYQPGAALPDFSQAEAGFAALADGPPGHEDIWDVYQEPYFHMLFRAPDSAGNVEVYFNLKGTPPVSNRNSHTLKLKVRE